MKTIRFEGGTHNSIWRSGYRVYLDDHEPQIVEMSLFTYNNGILTRRRTKRYTVPPSGMIEPSNLDPRDNILDRDYGLHAIYLNGPSGMHAEGTMRRVDGGIRDIRQTEAKTLVEAVPVPEITNLVQWEKETPYWKIIGNCRWLRSDITVVWQHILKQIYYIYRDRKDRQLTIYDLCSADMAGCDGHPKTAHAGLPIESRGDRVDPAFYTFETNHTQGPDATVIWSDTTRTGTLLQTFDKERNMLYFKLFGAYFKNAISCLDGRFLGYIDGKVLNGEDYETAKKYNHLFHHHDISGNKINWNASVTGVL